MTGGDLSFTFGNLALPRKPKPKGKTKSTPPAPALCGTCSRSLLNHTMRERRACARGVDDRDRDL